MSSGVKVIIALFFAASCLPGLARDLNILVLQENSAINCRPSPLPQTRQIFQLDQEGTDVPINEEFDWDDCSNGSIILPVAQDLLKAGLADKVTLLPVGVEGTDVNAWAPGGRAYNKLQSALAIAKGRGTKFDYVFWQGGIVSAEFTLPEYYANISKVMKQIKLNARAGKFIISRSITCQGVLDPPKTFHTWNALQNFYSGPALDALDTRFYAEPCTLNKSGTRRLAKMWVEAIANAEAQAQLYQRESLLHYFKWNNNQ